MPADIVELTRYDDSAMPAIPNVPDPLALRQCRRIMIVGCSGSGKSTLARALGAAYDLPVRHLDAEFWKPGWQATEREAWLLRHAVFIAEERWVIDGTYTGTLEPRLAVADAVIYLDVSRWICLWRALRRTWRGRGTVREDMAPGCPERLNWGLVSYIWTFRKKYHGEMLRQFAAQATRMAVFHLQGAVEIRSFTRQVQHAIPA